MKIKKLLKKIGRTRFAFIAVLLILAAGVFSGIYYIHVRHDAASGSQEFKNIYTRFDMEAYDSVKTNYWDKATDVQLAQLFQASAGKVTGMAVALPSADRAGTAKMLDAVMDATSSPDGKRALSLAIVQVALYNLQPAGRNQLFSTAQVTSLRQEVSNVNPSNDLYDNLGVATTSNDADIKQTYENKVAALSAASTSATATSTKQQIQQLSYAYRVLSNPDTKMLYDQTKIEPTVFSRVIGGTLYVYIKQMSPSTVQEFVWAVNNASTTPGLDSMIMDLRGNIGGELAIVQGLSGLFLGNNQYAFDLFHQGDYQVQRTLLGKYAELERYRDIAVFINAQTQSSAELTAEILTHFNIARSVGVTSAGWGTIENTYPLQTDIDPANKYSLFLVNSITLRDDGQPIQSRGITPDVDISTPNWQSRLPTYFSSPSFIKAIKQTIAAPPSETE